MLRGVPANFGPAAPISLAGTRGGKHVRVIVAARSRSPNDPGLLDIHGIALEDIAVYCAKAKKHFRAAFLPVREELFAADAIILDRVASRPVRFTVPGGPAVEVGWDDGGFRAVVVDRAGAAIGLPAPLNSVAEELRWWRRRGIGCGDFERQVCQLLRMSWC
jgi:hypothetical protein